MAWQARQSVVSGEWAAQVMMKWVGLFSAPFSRALEFLLRGVAVTEKDLREAHKNSKSGREVGGVGLQRDPICLVAAALEMAQVCSEPGEAPRLQLKYKDNGHSR